jgi:hypothetical protein
MKKFFKKLLCKHIYQQLEGDPNLFYCLKCTKEKRVKDHTKFKPNPNSSIPVNTIIKIYENTPAFEQGEIGIILDYDSINKDYAVAPLRYSEKFQNDLFSLLEKQSKWVKKENFEVIEYRKPKRKYLAFLLCVLSLLVGSYLEIFFGY